MRYFTLLLPLFFQVILTTPSAHGQGWEAYIDHEDFEFSTLSIVYPSTIGGVCLGVNQPFQLVNPTRPTIFSFDEKGTFLSRDSLASTKGWEFIHGDKSEASYWLKDKQLRKLTSNNQIAWSYPCYGHNTNVQFLPNGNICLPNMEGTGFVRDLINSDGQLEVRFMGHARVAAGCDNSLIYTDDSNCSTTRRWTKINQFGQTLWELELDMNVVPLEHSGTMMGSLYDGTTFLFDYNYKSIIKLDVLGNVDWEKKLLEFSPNSDPYFHFLGSLVREDGSIVLSTWNHVSSQQQFTQFININPANGQAIWITSTNNPTNAALDCAMGEMPDGGVLACFGANITGINHHRVLLVRTDAQGQTIANSIHAQESAIIQAKVWPVPAHDQIVVSLPSELPTILSWKLIDLTGRVMRSGNSESESFTVRRNGLPSGIYWCQLLLENGNTAIGRVVFD